ncbi:MAG: site-specific DNA-methyltransferase, partial [candidate division Zixibacteria bacterium]|nr:site-specific DNA-methyltransferase [candidate division Zixibacteria bacterium]
MVEKEKSIQAGKKQIGGFLRPVLHLGDCREVMAGMQEDSISAVVCDPPYELNFMSRRWDNTGIAYDVDMWRQVLRVLKPGGHLLAFGGTRTSHRLTCAIEDAGFEIRDSIDWLYGSGFPKATDISKNLDKKLGVYIKGEISPNSRNSGASPSGCYGEGVQHKTLPNPQSEEAKAWSGWKSHSLKPAYEPILVAVKENDGTYANNALKHRISGLNIDGGRIAGGDRRMCGTTDKSGETSYVSGNREETRTKRGRFPANVILECTCDKLIDGKHTDPDCPCYILDRQVEETMPGFHSAGSKRKDTRPSGYSGKGMFP